MLDGPTGLFSFGMTLSLGSITVSSGEVLGVGTEEFGKTQLSTQKCIRARGTRNNFQKSIFVLTPYSKHQRDKRNS